MTEIIQMKTISARMIMIQENNKDKKTYIERFDAYSRFLHVLVIISFLSLATTGMVIKFSGSGAFQFISKLLGGYAVTGFIHRTAAIITFIYFALHITYLFKKKSNRKVTFKTLLSGENSLIPNKRDLIELIQTFK